MPGAGPTPVEANREATEAWNGPLYERWIAFRDIVTSGLASHGEAALAAHPPPPGGRALDVGCGLGDTTRRLGELVGPEGHAHGVDVAERMIETAAAEARGAGVANVSFAALDVQAHRFEQGYDYAFSRFGTMFFASPVGARNVRGALRPRRPAQHGRLAPQLATAGCTGPSRWSSAISRSRRRATSRPAGRGRSRCRAPTPSPTCCWAPASPRSSCAAATTRSGSGTTSTTRSPAPRRSAPPSCCALGRASERDPARDRRRPA